MNVNRWIWPVAFVCIESWATQMKVFQQFDLFFFFFLRKLRLNQPTNTHCYRVRFSTFPFVAIANNELFAQLKLAP